jgi:hypothetical protein
MKNITYEQEINTLLYMMNKWKNSCTMNKWKNSYWGRILWFILITNLFNNVSIFSKKATTCQALQVDVILIKILYSNKIYKECKKQSHIHAIQITLEKYYSCGNNNAIYNTTCHIHPLSF